MGFQIKIDGEAWADLDDFSLALLNGMASLEPFNQGKDATFQGIEVSLSDQSLLPHLLQLAALDTSRDIVIRSTQADLSGTVPGGLVNYELRLNDALVQSVSDSSAGVALSFSYSDIGITTFNKSFIPNGSFEWDAANNDAIPTDLPLVPVYQEPVGQIVPNQYVMAIDGVAGSLTDAGRVGWFEVVDFSTSLFSDGGGTGFTSQRVVVTVADQAGLAVLMTRAANNAVLSSIRIDSIGSAQSSVSRQFGDVRVEAIRENADYGYSVEFSFEEFRTTTVIADPANPGKNITQTGGYDIDTGAANPTISTTTPHKSAVAAAAPINFFMAINDIGGNATVGGKGGWFALDSMDFEIDAYGAAPTFSPLSLDFNSDVGLAKLLKRMTGPTPEIGRATVVGIDGKGNTVYTLDLAEVQIANLANPGTAGLALTLDFERFELSTSGYDASEVLVDAGRFGWNTLTNTAQGPLSSAVPGSATKATEGQAEKHYMTVSGMNGGGTEPGWVRSFELSEFDYSAFLNNGNPDFSDVAIRTLSDAGLVSMLGATTTGKLITGVRIDGVIDIGGIETRVNRLELSDVLVTNVQDSVDAGFSAGLDFLRFTYRTYDPSTGKTATLAGYDRATKQSFTGTTAIAPSTGSAEATPDVFVFSASGIHGDSALVLLKNGSEITGYSFGVSLPDADVNKLGFVAGDSVLDRVTLEFATDTALTKMLGLAASGNSSADIGTLWGLSDDGSGKLTESFALSMSKFIVTGVTDHAGAGFSVDLDFEQFELKQSRQNPLTGVIGKIESGSKFGWDDFLDTSATVASKLAGSASQRILADQFYIAVDGLFGDLTGKDRGGWLAVDEMSVSMTNLSELGETSSPPVAADTMSFTVTLDSDRGLARMAEALANGTAISAVQIDGTDDLLRNGVMVETTVQTYLLNEVYVTSVTDTVGPGFSVTFEIARWRHTAFGVNANGGIVQTSEAKWDFETNNAGDTLGGVNLTGLADNNTLAGGAAADVLDGGAGNDLILGFAENDTLEGGTGNDTLQGGTGNDLLQGGDHADRLRGESGADTLTGGLGADRFVFTTLDIGSTDVITDFNRAQGDLISLADAASGALTFITGAFTAVRQVRVVAIDATTSAVQVNLSGDLTPDLQITLQNTASPGLFTAGDFLL